MFIKNHRDQLIIINGQGGAQARLMPGMNEVSDDLWKEALKAKSRGPGDVDISLVQAMVDNGDLEVEKGTKATVAAAAANTGEGGMTAATGGVPPPNQPQGFLAFEEKDAKKAIAQTFDRELLQNGLKLETREPVRDAIAAQLKKLALTDEEKGGKR